MYQIGYMALECDPYCFVVKNTVNNLCDQCFRLLGVNKVKCKCDYVSYCSEKCQQIAYNDVHNVECYLLSQCDKKLDNKVRMWARLIIKNSKGLDNEWHLFANNNYISVNTIEFPYEQMLKDKDLNRDYMLDYQKLLKYLRGRSKLLKKMPEEEMKKLYYCMRYATFIIKETFSENTLGYGLYLAASVIKYSCKPNAVPSFSNGSRLKVLLVENMTNLVTLEQLDIGSHVSFGFEAHYGDNFKQKLDCGCRLCKGERLDFIMCANLKCGTPFLIQDKKCPRCDLEITETFVADYMQAQFDAMDILEKFKNSYHVFHKDELDIFEKFNKMCHMYNSLRIELQKRFYSNITKKQLINEILLEMYYAKFLHGLFSVEYFELLFKLVEAYCENCQRHEKLSTCKTVDKHLRIITRENHPCIIRNKIIFKKLLTSKGEKKNFLCTCNDRHYYDFEIEFETSDTMIHVENIFHYLNFKSENDPSNRKV